MEPERASAGASQRKASRALLSVLAALLLVLVPTTFAFGSPYHISTTQVGADGAVQEDAPIREIVGLGDSVPAGTGCNCTSFVTLLGQLASAAQSSPVSVSNASVDGQTSAGLRAELDDRLVARVVAGADVVVITIGANDFDDSKITDTSSVGEVYHDQLVQLGQNMAAILHHVAALRGDRPTKVIVTGYWNVFLDGPEAAAEGPSYVENSRDLTNEVNAVLQRVAEHSGATYVDLQSAFASAPSIDLLLAPDGDHPSAQGHQLIADTVWAAIKGSRSS